MSIVLSFVLLATASSPYTLTPERAVYKVGDSRSVVFTFRNEGSIPLQFPSASPWVVWNGDAVVYTPSEPPGIAEVAAKGSKTWSWNKKDKTGKFVGPGTYSIRLATLPGGPELKVDVAITGTGSLAGTHLFPLALGNTWIFESSNPQDGNTTVKFIKRSGTSEMYLLQGLGAAKPWCQVTGALKPVFSINIFGSAYHPLFRFGLTKGSVYPVNIPFLSWKKIQVGATDESVTTPAGQFVGCYRLDVIEASSGEKTSFSFAAGVGIVQIVRKKGEKVDTVRLRRARVKGADGAVYSIGRE